MISRKPLADRNDVALSQIDASPEKKKISRHFEPNGRTSSADSGFVSPETICRPKLSASRRSSPATGNHPFTSFRIEDSADSCPIPDALLTKQGEIPSTIADLINKPLKFTGQFSSKHPRSLSLISEGTSTPNRKNELSPTKLSFDSCDSSDDSPPSLLPANLFRKSVGFRRSLSYTEPELSKKEALRLLPSEGTPVFNPKRHKFQNDENSPYKTYTEALVSHAQPKRQDSVETNDKKKGDGTSSLTPEVKRLCFTRSHSESALTTTSCSIIKALERFESDPNLIGDGSKSYVLPITKSGKHQDLKEITRDTLAGLLEGRSRQSVTSFKVIDCRYPYEFSGGHIQGAINLFTRKQIYDELLSPKLNRVQVAGYTEERNILIFHCEFSSQRGPDMCRFLRDSDRVSNSQSYPCLYYPELYVLYGGYKAFYEEFPQLCDPQTYLPMDHPNHLEDCRRYKSRTKLEIPPSHHERSKNKAKSQNKMPRTASFAKKCNFPKE